VKKVIAEVDHNMFLRICERLLLRLMLLDHYDNNNAAGTCDHYGPSEGRLVLLHRFFVLGAVSLLIFGAMYFAFMSLLNIIFLIKSLANSLYEMLSDIGPAIATGVSDFWRVMLNGISEIWSICTRDNVQYLLALVIIYHLMPTIVTFFCDWRRTTLGLKDGDVCHSS
jgi:hypothetical protein